MKGLTFEKWNECLDLVGDLPPNKIISDSTPVESNRVQLAVSSNQTGDDKFASHVLKAFASLNGVAGMKVSWAMSKVHAYKEKQIRLGEAQDVDGVAKMDDAIAFQYTLASKWKGLREYYFDKMAHLIESEGVGWDLHPEIEPFPLDLPALSREIKLSGGDEDDYQAKVAYESSKRADIISLIEGVKTENDCGDDIRFDSIFALVPKLTGFAENEEGLAKKLRLKHTNFAIEHNLKKEMIEKIQDRIVTELNDAYDIKGELDVH